MEPEAPFRERKARSPGLWGSPTERQRWAPPRAGHLHALGRGCRQQCRHKHHFPLRLGLMVAEAEPDRPAGSQAAGQEPVKTPCRTESTRAGHQGEKSGGPGPPRKWPTAGCHAARQNGQDKVPTGVGAMSRVEQGLTWSHFHRECLGQVGRGGGGEWG